jgi:predicted adenylyl cyclase CyaB
VKEIEVKIYGIDERQILDRLRVLGAVFVKDVQQRDTYYRVKGRKLRVREEREKNDTRASITVKYGKSIEHGHKIEEEFDMPASATDAHKLLTLLGLSVKAVVERKRTYYTLHACSVEICRLPGVQPYLEIEGSKDAIARVTHELGYSERDYDTTPPVKKFGVHKTSWTFDEPDRTNRHRRDSSDTRTNRT